MKHRNFDLVEEMSDVSHGRSEITSSRPDIPNAHVGHDTKLPSLFLYLVYMTFACVAVYSISTQDLGCEALERVPGGTPLLPGRLRSTALAALALFVQWFSDFSLRKHKLASNVDRR